MSTTVTIPEGFFYVAPALVGTAFVALGQSLVVATYRKRAKIAYPQMYAEKKEAGESRDAYLFNCAQRAHQNTLEQLPGLYAVSIVAALQYPIFTASVLGIWSLGRISYTRGYILGDPAKRITNLYRLASLLGLSLYITSAYVSGNWLYQGLSAKFFN